jgi:uncharacterized membrane-anchored protein YhcB (DUF1043 family)
MAVELGAGISLVALLIGGGVGYLLANRTGPKARVVELESALDAAQNELAEYKRDVYGQFAQTAEKFRDLDRSYNELHRQLAESSVALCGDAGTPLLQAPDQSDVDVLESSNAVVSDGAEPIDEDLGAAVDDEQEEIVLTEATVYDETGDTDIDDQEPANDEIEGHETSDSATDPVVEPVPTLNELTEDASGRRESA